MGGAECYLQGQCRLVSRVSDGECAARAPAVKPPDAGLGRRSEVALPGFCQRKSDSKRSAWQPGRPHTESYGPFSPAVGQHPRQVPVVPRRRPHGRRPLTLTPALPRTGCVTLDKLLSRLSFPLYNEGCAGGVDWLEVSNTSASGARQTMGVRVLGRGAWALLRVHAGSCSLFPPIVAMKECGPGGGSPDV